MSGCPENVDLPFHRAKLQVLLTALTNDGDPNHHHKSLSRMLVQLLIFLVQFNQEIFYLLVGSITWLIKPLLNGRYYIIQDLKVDIAVVIFHYCWVISCPFTCLIPLRHLPMTRQPWLGYMSCSCFGLYQISKQTENLICTYSRDRVFLSIGLFYRQTV